MAPLQVMTLASLALVSSFKTGVQTGGRRSLVRTSATVARPGEALTDTPAQAVPTVSSLGQAGQWDTFAMASQLTSRLSEERVGVGAFKRDRLIMQQILLEASEVENSELLGGAMVKHVLGCTTLAEVLAHVIACRLARGTFDAVLPQDSLQRSIEESLRDDERPGADLVQIMSKDPAAVSWLQALMFLKGFQAVQAQRVSARFWARRDFEGRTIAFAIQNRVSELWAIDIHPGARLEGGLLMDHGTGVVIGETAVVGEGCTILHGVTLGGTGKERGDRHPKLGKGVVLGAGSTVLGNIALGDRATVGSQAVVTKPIPSGMTVVGLNKILDQSKSREVTQVAENRPETWAFELTKNQEVKVDKASDWTI